MLRLANPTSIAPDVFCRLKGRVLLLLRCTDSISLFCCRVVSNLMAGCHFIRALCLRYRVNGAEMCGIGLAGWHLLLISLPLFLCFPRLALIIMRPSHTATQRTARLETVCAPLRSCAKFYWKWIRERPHLVALHCKSHCNILTSCSKWAAVLDKQSRNRGEWANFPFQRVCVCLCEYTQKTSSGFPFCCARGSGTRFIVSGFKTAASVRCYWGSDRSFPTEWKRSARQ